MAALTAGLFSLAHASDCKRKKPQRHLGPVLPRFLPNPLYLGDGMAAHDEHSIIIQVPTTVLLDFPDSMTASSGRTLIEVREWCCISVGLCSASAVPHPQISSDSRETWCIGGSGRGHPNTQVRIAGKGSWRIYIRRAQLFLAGMFCLLRPSRDVQRNSQAYGTASEKGSGLNYTNSD